MKKLVHKIETTVMNKPYQTTINIIELSPDSIIIIQHGMIRYANTNLLKLSGYEYSELIGQSFLNFVSPESQEQVSLMFQERERGKNVSTKYEARGRKKSGEDVDIEASICHVIFENEEAYQVTLRDISKLRDAERKYQNIIDFAPIGFYKTSRKGDFVLVNNEMAYLLGYENKDELLTKNISEFYYSSKERERLIKRYDKKETSEVKNVEVKFKKKDGSPIWILLTARAIKDKTDKTLSYDGFLIDISDRKQRDLELTDRMQFEKVSNDISYQFVRSNLSETDSLINSALKKLGQFTKVDRVCIFQLSNDKKKLNPTHEWCSTEIKALKESNIQFATATFSWWMKRISNFKILKYDDINNLPDEAQIERKTLTQQGIKSLLGLPILSKGELIGFIGFDSIKQHKQWQDQDITMLESITDLISSELSKAKQLKETREAKQEAEENAKRYKSLFNNNNSVMLIIDPSNDNIIDANKAACQFYGYSYDEIISLTMHQIIAKPQENTLNQCYKQISTQCQCRHRLANGETKAVELYTGSVNISGKEMLYSIVHDITKRKVAEENVLKLSTSIEQSPISILITDVNGVIEYVNSYYSEVTGYSTNELIGNTPNIINSGVQDIDFYKELWDTILSGNRWEGEMCNKKKNGQLYWERAIISPIKNDAGIITHFAGIKEDISERKKMIDELILSKEKAEESDRLKSAFLANMSHEIRTPMNGILGFTNLLGQPALSDERKEKYIQIINQSGERLLNTVTDIIEISKIEAGIVTVNRSEININETIARLVDTHKKAAQAKGLQLQLSTSENDEIRCYTDRSKLEIIVNKLITNAIKYSDTGTISATYKRTKDHIDFCISDEGIGIPSNRLSAIFNRFEQADIEDTKAYQGSGLGLAISKAYVTLLGGHISVESQVNVGSQFYFTIPYQKP